MSKQPRWLGGSRRKTPAERPNVLMCSPFVRARQTCTAVAMALGIDLDEIQADERLREKEFGILDRHTKHGILSKFPELAAQRALVGKFYFRPPGGESWCDVILRVRSIVEVLRRDHVEDRVLIVAHQVIVNCFRYLLECMDEAKILAVDREADVPNCGITEYGLDRKTTRRPIRLAHGQSGSASGRGRRSGDHCTRRACWAEMKAPAIKVTLALLRKWPLPDPIRQRKQRGPGPRVGRGREP